MRTGGGDLKECKNFIKGVPIRPKIPQKIKISKKIGFLRVPPLIFQAVLRFSRMTHILTHIHYVSFSRMTHNDTQFSRMTHINNKIEHCTVDLQKLRRIASRMHQETVISILKIFIYIFMKKLNANAHFINRKVISKFVK